MTKLADRIALLLAVECIEPAAWDYREAFKLAKQVITELEAGLVCRNKQMAVLREQFKVLDHDYEHAAPWQPVCHYGNGTTCLHIAEQMAQRVAQQPTAGDAVEALRHIKEKCEYDWKIGAKKWAKETPRTILDIHAIAKATLTAKEKE